MLPMALQSVGQNGILAITVIPLLCLYFGLIAYLTYDASQDSAWVIWLLLFLAAGPITIPFYIVASLHARRWTSQANLDRKAFEKRGTSFKFVSEIERFKYYDQFADGQGTMYEPSLGISVRRSGPSASDAGRLVFTDERAEELLAQGDPQPAWEYLAEMYQLAADDRDADRVATYKHYISRLPGGIARLAGVENADNKLEAPPSSSGREVPF